MGLIALNIENNLGMHKMYTLNYCKCFFVFIYYSLMYIL